MQLKARTAPAPATPEPKEVSPDSSPSKAKASPFGDATAVDSNAKVKDENSAEFNAGNPQLSNAEDGKEDSKALTDKDSSKEDGTKKEKKRREPEVVNSRAAALESAPDVKREVSMIWNTLRSIVYAYCGMSVNC